MSEKAIEVSRLSKRYRLGEYSGGMMIRDAIMDMMSMFGRGKRSPEQFMWALRDVSFSVEKGEVLGVVGRNGAGKSTLLKLLSRITYPTSGAVHTIGRVASLLEVGTGFHEELTGRENIYLNGSILGMKSKEIEGRLDEIVEFSGVGKFIDTPIKRYSSGMRLRLGFGVAAHLSPDILFVDEVLAVGDAEFQKKCLNAMEDLRTSGRTVVFVSHNMAAIENLCSRCIWIDGGRIRADGDARTVVSEYLRTFAQATLGTVSLEGIESRSGNGHARFTSIEFLNSSGEVVTYLRSGDRVRVRLHYRSFQRLRDLVVGIHINTEFGTMLASNNNWATGDPIPVVDEGDGYVELEIDCLYLLPGRFYLSLWLGRPENLHDVLKNCIAFDVEPSDFYGSGRGIDSQFGLMFFPSRWHSCPPQERISGAETLVEAGKGVNARLPGEEP
jgi:lipopolysaccharide transport system ATP-binding protein